MKTSSTRILIGLILLMFIASPAFAKDIVTQSPNHNLIFTVNYNTHGLWFSINAHGTAILNRSPLSITIDGEVYPGIEEITTIRRSQIECPITPTVKTIASTILEKCNETFIAFGNTVALRVRAYNDGVVYRWESQLDKKDVVVNAEELSLHFARDFKTYYPIPNGSGFFSHQENAFDYKHISQITLQQNQACVPILFDLNHSRYLLISDVNVQQYPGLWFKPDGDGTLSAVFPHYPAEVKLSGDRHLKVSKYSDFLAKTTGSRNFPWRAFVITNAEGLLSSTMLYTLADPCRLEDTSWIKPGKVAWDWWNACNITDVAFKAGINQDTYKNYIDFAAANDLQYIILDEGWSVRGPDNLLNVVEDLDIAKLVEYGKSKNVGVILWMTSTALERSFDKAFEQFSAWGIKGMKVDFMQRDDQLMMEFCEKVAIKAAEQKLLVDFHGGSKPTGLQRTYPNVLTHESVLGLEQSKWSKKASPDMAVLLPFIRMVVGPMDYTPGAIDNFTDSAFRQDFNNPASLGTRCHQLAMYITFLSPLQMLADTPTKYRNNPETMKFLRRVPTTWEQTVVLKAEVGQVVALARRNGDSWYLSAMTNWSARELSLPLGFLANGDYQLEYWADGPNAHQDATDMVTDIKTVSANDSISINLAPGGGYAAIIKPLE